MSLMDFFAVEPMTPCGLVLNKHSVGTLGRETQNLVFSYCVVPLAFASPAVSGGVPCVR
ncbi:hypothetical protein [Roseovarius aquimarinus]|uniref:hypothetical protein n=1 Tax=Roseovarius aquimarinus TaxID=1229156 RepID=UPI003635CFAA